MTIPLQIQFQNMDASPAVEAAIEERARKLEKFADDIVSSRVTVEAPHRHQKKGKVYRVVVDIRTPGEEVVASRDPGKHHAHEDVFVAVHDAFNAVRRQLQDRIRARRPR